MRRVTITCGLTLLILATGCNHTRWNSIFNPKPGEPNPKDVPTAAALVEYMNKNAERLKSLKCYDLRLTAAKGVMPINLEGVMLAQQPRDFRLKASWNGKPAVDLGSNGQEFWYWLRESPYQFYCAHTDFKSGNLNTNDKLLPPFQPEWIMETLGMSDYGPPERYELKDLGDRVHLIERTKSPRGHPVQKVIVFNRKPATVPTPQVLAYLLLDEKTGKEICSAHIHAAQLDSKNAAMLPEKMTLYWRDEGVKLTLRLIGPSANVEVPAAGFARQKLPNIPGFDLASGKLEGQTTSIQNVQGWSQK
jgi:hypothetical protein